MHIISHQDNVVLKRVEAIFIVENATKMQLYYGMYYPDANMLEIQSK